MAFHAQPYRGARHYAAERAMERRRQRVPRPLPPLSRSEALDIVDDLKARAWPAGGCAITDGEHESGVPKPAIDRLTAREREAVELVTRNAGNIELSPFMKALLRLETDGR